MELMVASCRLCGSEGAAEELGVCGACIRSEPGEALRLAEEAHRRSRHRYGFAHPPPKGGSGVCRACVNECELHEGERSPCGLRRCEGGRVKHLTGDEAVVQAYHDPLPTNCVSAWVCAGCSTSGYPRYSYTPGPEVGYRNLAVFYGACSYDCLFCQNWEFRVSAATLSPRMTPEELAALADERTSCICYFGGDPAVQMPHSLRTSRIALETRRGGILRICYETNGSMSWGMLRQAVEVCLSSGGCIKFDLKAWDENLHVALTGASNRRTLENFARVAELVEERPSPPLLVGSTLLVPGYVDEREVEMIARFIAELNPEIPYALLAFHPCYMMRDLPRTTKEQAEACLRAAKRHLTNVHLGNRHLLT